MDLEVFKKEAQHTKKSNKKFLNRLKSKSIKNLDNTVHALHEEIFEEVDCLECANCCKTSSPIIIPKDIDRIARHLKMRPSELIDKYLHIDEDGDYVLNEAPCVFLGADNYCSIYEARPRACREYPHTNRRRFDQILNLTYKNTLVCPAVLKIVERLKKVY